MEMKRITTMSNGLRMNVVELAQGRLIRIHPTWYTFIKHCESLRYGEIEKLKIQDGLPMMAEEVKKKIKFSE